MWEWAVNVPSFQCLAYAAFGAVLYKVARRSSVRKYILLAFNLVFLVSLSTGPKSLLPYAVFIATGVLSTALIRRSGSLTTTWALIGLIVAELCYFKQYGFIPQQLGLHFTYVTVGLSYVCFRVLHLLIESRDAPDAVPRSIVSYLNYTLHFPALVSGPIQLYSEYQAAEQADPKFTAGLIGDALWRICLGLFKVVIVAGLLSYLHRQEMDSYLKATDWYQTAMHGATLIAVYPLFLYANFSGYVDFVIGIAKLYGFDLPENFNKPFSSENFLAFWSTWHITLSNWLKTYVYTPLLMTCMRRWESKLAEPYFAVLAYFVTFFLVGVWHGQTAMFLFFGVLQGGGVAANKFYQIQIIRLLGNKKYKQLRSDRLYRALSRGLTFSWFAFTLIWFWASSAELEGLYRTASALSLTVALAALFMISTLALEGVTRLEDLLTGSSVLQSRYALCALATIMFLVVLCSLFIVGAPPPEIVYKQF
jgi:D-alanyl-lipoteichoic acid acyltransferase DltB (MBOAT superfamily)